MWSLPSSSDIITISSPLLPATSASFLFLDHVKIVPTLRSLFLPYDLCALFFPLFTMLVSSLCMDNSYVALRFRLECHTSERLSLMIQSKIQHPHFLPHNLILQSLQHFRYLKFYHSCNCFLSASSTITSMRVFLLTNGSAVLSVGPGIQRVLSKRGFP